MKAITLWEPWATFIALGYKTIETRDWATQYRGPLAIHASKMNPEEGLVLRLCDALGIERGRLPLKGSWPRGKIVAVANLTAIQTAGLPEMFLTPIPERDLILGDCSIGRKLWMLGNIKRVIPPVQVSGHMALWDVPVDILEQITRSLIAG